VNWWRLKALKMSAKPQAGVSAGLTAKEGASPLQKGVCGVIVLAILALPFVVSNPIAWLAFAVSPIFLALIVFQLGAAFQTAPLEFKEHSSTALRVDWPIYSVLVPLYHETVVIDQLLKAFRAIDYPSARMEVLFLVEEDDLQTKDALENAGLSPWMQIVIVPAGYPRTKPRALNHGLLRATGHYITVYDAEDIPDIDQLKMAVQLFERSPPEVKCLQARLAIDNAPDSWFSLMMCIEYAALFDTIKCGLASADLPVALGGTSNHFRHEDMLQLAGWDSFNVTEDADLGIRIARQAGKVMDLPSTTLEEAPIHFKGWLGQRRRWLKGWIQTGICHSREPLSAILEMGFVNWLVVMVQIFGVVVGALTFPFFGSWFLWNLWIGNVWANADLFQIATNSVAIVIFFMGLLAMVLPAVIGLQRRRAWHLIPWLIMFPFYVLFISAAAWLAVMDFMRRPFHWEKTAHGLGRRRPGAFKNRR
jgi:glycosyltransferase XagB